MAAFAAGTRPVLVIPPENTEMPSRQPIPIPTNPAEIVPALVTPPRKVETSATEMPVSPAAIEPPLVIPPEKVATAET